MKIAVKCGLAVGFGSFLWMLFEYWLGFRTTNFGQHLITAPFAVVVLIAGVSLAIYLSQLRTSRPYTFKDGFKTGMVVSAVAAVVMFFGAYLYYGVIDRNFQQRAENWAVYVETTAGTPVDQAKQDAASGAWKHNMHVRALSQIPLFLVEGAVVSAIASAVATRKKR